MKIFNKKKTFYFLSFLVSGVGIFFLTSPAHAGWATEVVANLLSVIISVLGTILSLVVKVLIGVAQYSDFINAPAITNGWKIVRDVCNMFFVLILLVIAFATILKIERYNYKQWLPKLILMAILINFSKTICGLLIDFAQVIMLTFVNAFKDVGGGNIISTLGLTDIMTLAKDSSTGAAPTFLDVTGGYMLGLIYLLISLVVIVTMLAMLVVRIVMIWIYVVLSPMAYLFSAFPDGKSYASQWWSEFTKNLIVGPVLAFFIWLSFASLQVTNYSQFPMGTGADQIAGADTGVTITPDPGNTAFSATNASTPNSFLKFVIAIGMLIGGLKISQQIGGAAGGLAGKGMSKIQKGAAFAGGAIGGFALGRAKAVGRGVRNTGLGLASSATKGLGNVIGDNKAGNALKSIGGVGLQWRSDMIAKQKKIKTDKRQKFLEKMGMGEKTMDKTSEFLKTDAGKEFHTAAHGAGVGALIGSAGGLGGSILGAGLGFVGGGAASWASGLVKKYAKSKANDPNRPDRPDKLDKEGDIYAERAANARALGNNKLANDFQYKSDIAKQASRNWKRTAKAADFAQSFTSATTQKAAANGSKTIRNARESVKQLATNGGTEFMRDASSGTFYGTGTDQPKKVIEQLTSPENADAPTARLNAENWINGLNINSSNHDFDVLKGMAKGIAAADKGGMDISSLGAIIAAINRQNGLGDRQHGLDGQTVEGLKPSVIAYRNTGQVGEQGNGEFAVNTFANNKDNEDEKNYIAADFNKLDGTGLDVNAESVHTSGEAMGPVIQALKTQISEERAKVDTEVQASRDNGTNSPESDREFGKRYNDLDSAEQRLNDPALSSLNVINSGSANYGRQQRMTSKYHEDIHAGGVEDEELTEGISKNLMENKLYGRNPVTGGQHATEIAQKVKVMKDAGKSNAEIMTEVDKDVKSRVNTEGKNRAERVARLQSGEKETVSQATSKPEESNVNTEELQNSLGLLTKKFEASAAAFNMQMGGNKGKAMNYQSLTYPLKQLNLNMMKNTALLRKMVGSKAPSTIIEASAINDEIENESSEQK